MVQDIPCPCQASPTGSMPPAWGQLRCLRGQRGHPCLVGAPECTTLCVQKQTDPGVLGLLREVSDLCVDECGSNGFVDIWGLALSVRWDLV